MSRTGFGLVSTTKHARFAKELFLRVKALHPELLNLHSDNGSDHRGALDDGLPEGVVHWVSRPRVPTDNARLERFHLTLQDECFSASGEAPSVVEMQKRLDGWLAVYNGVRPHAALGNLTPSEYLQSLAPPSGVVPMSPPRTAYLLELTFPNPGTKAFAFTFG